jgi:putative tricarboxylic transport membrane protein
LAAKLPREAWPLYLETAFWLILAGGAWLLSMEFAGKDMLFRWGAEFWPRAVAVLMAILAVLQFAIRFRQLEAAASPVGQEEAKAHASPRQQVRLGLTLLVPITYLYLLPRAGYFILTPFFISLMMLLFGMRRPLHLLGTAAGIYVAFLLVFSKLLAVPLPTGYWPVFYHFNTAFAKFLGL